MKTYKIKDKAITEFELQEIIEDLVATKDDIMLDRILAILGKSRILDFCSDDIEKAKSDWYQLGREEGYEIGKEDTSREIIEDFRGILNLLTETLDSFKNKIEDYE